MHERIFRNKQRGQVTMLMTFALVPMVGLLGLATDLGYMHYLKASAQAAADAAALGGIVRFHYDVPGTSFTCGTSGVICGTSYSCPTTLTSASNGVETACLYAKQNGFQATGDQNVLVDSNVGSPSTAPGLSSATYYISVRVSQRVPQLFAAVTGNLTGLITARSTAAATPAKDCLYVLDPVSSGAYYQNGSTTVTLACGVYDNSSSSTALYNSGGASVLSASEYDIVGNYQWNGTLSPTPNIGAPQTGDPMASLTPPSPCASTGGCDLADCTAHPTQTVIDPGNNNTQQVYPGTYCGGIMVNHGTANFNAGMYILVGGGLASHDTNSKITGSNVTFYNTYNSANSYTGVSLPANSSTSLSASTTGTYAGILFMGDRSITTSPTLYTESLQGGATAKFEGTIYFPKSILQFRGNPTMTTANYTIIVGWRVQVQGNSTLNANYSMLPGGTPSNQQVGLVE